MLGFELYRYDPFENAASLVADINQGSASSRPGPQMVPLNGELYFPATTSTAGRELFKYDPQTNTVSLVRDLRAGASSSFPGSLTVLGGKLFFTFSGGPFGREPYAYDPIADSVSLVADIAPGPSGSATEHHLTSIGEVIFFERIEWT